MNVFRARRILIWGVLSVVVGAALAISFVLAGRAVGEAQRDAEQRAEGYANSVLYDALTPSMVEQPIGGQDYGEVLLQVQAGILSDDAVVRVRVWNRSEQLVFSSDQRDRLGQQAGSGGVLKEVFGGTTVNDVTGPRVAPEPGLAGTNDKLLVSYVPLRLGSQTAPSTAVEIDQGYSSILASAHALWRPLQAGIGVVLLFAFTMFLVSFRSRGVPSDWGLAGDPRAAERLRSLEKQMKELQKRARDADDRAKQADDRAKQADDRVKAADERADAAAKAKTALEQQLANSERDLRDTLAASRTSQEDASTLSARVPELERELAELRARAAAAESIVPGVSADELAAAQARAAEAEGERDRLAREIEGLNIAMSESNAEHGRVAELEARLAEVQAAGADADERVAAAQARATEAEQRLGDSDRRIAELEERARSSVEQAQGDLDRISIHLSETQAALAESTDKLTNLQTNLQRVQQEKDDAVAELQHAGLATGERDREVERLRAAITERSGEIEHARAETAAKAAELDQLRAETAAKTAELDQLRAEAVAKNAELDELRTYAATHAADLERHRAEAVASAAELQQLHADLDQVRASLSSKDEELTHLRAAASSGDADADELRRRVTELEDMRRTDVVEVQQAHEQLANTQFELKQARERIEDLEDPARKFAAASVEAGMPFPPTGNGALAEPAVALGEDVTSSGSPVLEPPDEATVGSRLSAFRKRRQSLGLEDLPVPTEQWEPPVVAEPHDEHGQHLDDPPTPEISPEGLSLRERLTRAAAARHRVTTPSNDQEH